MKNETTTPRENVFINLLAVAIVFAVSIVCSVWYYYLNYHR